MIGVKLARILSIVLLPFILGTFIVFKFSGISLLFIFLYMASAFLLSRSLLDKTFFESTEENRYQEKPPELLLIGQPIPAFEVKDKQEELFLNNFEFKRVVSRRLLTFLYFALVFVLFFYLGRVEVSLTTAVPVLCGFLILRSLYIGHLLLPLVINIWSVISHFGPDSSISLYACYAFAVFYTLNVISDVSGVHFKWSRADHLLPVGLLFLALVYGSTFFFETKEPPSIDDQEMSSFNPSKEALSLSKKAMEQHLSDLSMMPGMDSREIRQKIESQLDDISDMESMLSSKSSLQGNIEAVKHKFERIMESNQSLKREMKNLKTKMMSGNLKESQILKDFESRHGQDQEKKLTDLVERMRENQEELLRYQGKSDQTGEERAQVRELEASREDLKKEFEQMHNLELYEREEIEEYISTKGKEVKILDSINGNKNKLAQQEQKLKALKEKVQGPVTSREDLQEMAKLLQETKGLDVLTNEMKNETFEPLDVKVEMNDLLQAIKPLEDEKKNYFKKIFPLLVFLAVFAAFHFFFNKKGVKAIKTENSAKLIEIQNILKKIKKTRLSAREEIILHYNLLHDLLGEVQYLDLETPPSCIVQEDLCELHPEIEKATLSVTNIYARCFYGNKEISGDSLKVFRRSAGTVFKIYGLRY